MKSLAALALVVALTAPALVVASDREDTPEARPRPWAELGLSDRQAAVVLLNRFTFGPRPGEVDEVVATGIWEWFDAQLNPGPDPVLDRLLAAIPVDGLDGHEVTRRYRGGAQLRLEAARAGALEGIGDEESDRLQAAILEYAAARGLRPMSELHDGLVTHSLVRMVSGRHQLREVMTELWLDHLCVSVADPDVAPWLLDYQMRAIRPRALGPFRDVLGASARHPAMLLYLDGNESSAAPGVPTTAQVRDSSGAVAAPVTTRPGGEASQPGPNENYARELMELHTLGVDGGYTEADVLEVARAFTGWTVAGSRASDYFDDTPSGRGFRFRPERHDAGPKHVLGHGLPPGRGLEDGEDVLDLLAGHPSTARHVCRRLATHFVSDDPPAGLVEDLAAVWRATGGDLRPVLSALVANPTFWREVARESKIKTPLQLEVSALRALDARVSDGRVLGRWLERMGQPLYAAPSPAGWGDVAALWLDSGSVVARQRLGFALAHGAVEGVEMAPIRPPEAAADLEQRLALWADRLMPERPKRFLAEPVLATAGPFLAAHLNPEEREQRLVAVLLASPEFQRR